MKSTEILRRIIIIRPDSQPIPDLRSLDDAVRLLRKLRKELSSGSLTVWRIVDHACKHIEHEIKAELSEDSTRLLLGEHETRKALGYFQ
jgi:hypothetical protein